MHVYNYTVSGVKHLHNYVEQFEVEITANTINGSSLPFASS